MKHTEKELKAATDLKLAVIAASVMGWELVKPSCFPVDEPEFWVTQIGSTLTLVRHKGTAVSTWHYSPATNANQALELAEFVCKSEGPMSFEVDWNNSWYKANFFHGLKGWVSEFGDKSFARALTICSILAHQQGQQ